MGREASAPQGTFLLQFNDLLAMQLSVEHAAAAAEDGSSTPHMAGTLVLLPPAEAALTSTSAAAAGSVKLQLLHDMGESSGGPTTTSRGDTRTQIPTHDWHASSVCTAHTHVAPKYSPLPFQHAVSPTCPFVCTSSLFPTPQHTHRTHTATTIRQTVPALQPHVSFASTPPLLVAEALTEAEAVVGRALELADASQEVFLSQPLLTAVAIKQLQDDHDDDSSTSDGGDGEGWLVLTVVEPDVKVKLEVGLRLRDLLAHAHAGEGGGGLWREVEGRERGRR